MPLLVIDDDTELCGLLAELLRREGLDVDFAHDGQTGLERCRQSGVDLVVLDVMLPGIDGFSLLRAIRKESDVPVIMLTARGDDVDRIVGLEMGADDYLPKPFNARELIARIRAVLRRRRPPDRAGELLEIDEMTLDVASREVRSGSRVIDLTTLEFEIIEILMRAAGRVLSRDQIMEHLYDRTAGPLDRSIDVHVSHLRKKLGHDAERIKTVRGVGYQFRRRSTGTPEVEP